MRRDDSGWFGGMLLALVAVVHLPARADDGVDPSALAGADLTGPFPDGIDWLRDAAGRAADDGPPLAPVAVASSPAAERWYVSGIVGASFATLSSGGANSFLDGTTLAATGSAQDPLVTGGGAVGVALPRATGQLRLEVEGRSRGPLHGENVLVASSGGTVQGVPLNVSATGGWSATANLWHDWFVGDHVAFYGGGGFGAGGYRFGLALPEAAASGSAVVNAFAWQVGTGLIYDWSDRVALDVGYRYFAMGNVSANLAVDAGASGALSLGSYNSSFNASEFLLSVRIYEPFRAWR